MVYLDNAATSFPKPETVYQAVDRFARQGLANPGRAFIQSTSDMEGARTLNVKYVGYRQGCCDTMTDMGSRGKVPAERLEEVAGNAS